MKWKEWITAAVTILIIESQAAAETVTVRINTAICVPSVETIMMSASIESPTSSPTSTTSSSPLVSISSGAPVDSSMPSTGGSSLSSSLNFVSATPDQEATSNSLPFQVLSSTSLSLDQFSSMSSDPSSQMLSISSNTSQTITSLSSLVISPSTNSQNSTPLDPALTTSLQGANTMSSLSSTSCVYITVTVFFSTPNVLSRTIGASVTSSTVSSTSSILTKSSASSTSSISSASSTSSTSSTTSTTSTTSTKSSTSTTSSTLSTSSSASSTSSSPATSSSPTSSTLASTTKPSISSTTTSSSSTTSTSTSSSTPTSVPSSVSQPTSTNLLRLSNPTSVAVADPTNDIDEAGYGIALPFLISLYTQNDTSVTVTTNGLLTIGEQLYENNTDNGDIGSLPSLEILPGTACVWWEHLYIAADTQQGIYYQLDGPTANRTLSVEYLLSDPNGNLYQVVATYVEGLPGQMEYYYFTDGDSGSYATIGIQGLDTDGYPEATQYESGMSGQVYSGLLLMFDTNPNDTVSGNTDFETFNLKCYPPGSWPAGVSC